MGNKKRPKTGPLDEFEAYLPLIQTRIPAEARLFPKNETEACDFRELLAEPRAVFDAQALPLDTWK